MDVPGNGQMDAVLGRAQAADGQNRLRALGDKKAPHNREDLARTAREFESVFLDIMMQAMRRTVPENDLMGSGGATRLYRQMHDTEIAHSLATSGGGLGIAKLLESQFAREFDGQDAAGPQGGDPVAAGSPSPAQALSRYRQHGDAEATGPLAPANLSKHDPAGIISLPTSAAEPTRLGPPAPAPLAVPAGRPVEPVPGPGRLGLVPTDRRLATAPMNTAEADTVQRFGPAIERAAKASGVDPRLVLAVVMEESGGDPTAHSRAGAHGLMQLMPGTARDLGVADRSDPVANLAGGARYLADQLQRFEGRVDLALAAYNAGPGHVQRAGGRVPDFAETRGYVRRVMDRFERLRAGTEPDRSGTELDRSGTELDTVSR